MKKLSGNRREREKEKAYKGENNKDKNEKKLTKK